MFSSPRKSHAHKVFEALRGRKHFSDEEMAAFRRFQQGYEGEIIFADLLTKYLRRFHEKIFSLQLNVNGSESQYDCVLIFQDEIYHFEIKNFTGNYKVKDQMWYNFYTNKEIRNPLHQLSRGNIILKEFLLKNNINLELKSFIVFVNPNFHLYEAPIDNRIIFPAQIIDFLNKLQAAPNTKTSQPISIKKILTGSHLPNSAYEQIPDYHYGELRRGFVCNQCKGMLKRTRSKNVKCDHCDLTELFQTLLGENIQDYCLLFPDNLIQVESVGCWLGNSVSRSSIKRVLKSNFTLMKKGRYSYYSE